MKTFNFTAVNEKDGACSICNKFTTALRNDLSMEWVDSRTPDFYRIVFRTLVSMLKAHQSKTTPRIGMVLKDNKGNFKIGAIMSYHKDDDGEEDKGNWMLEFTFNPEDLKDLDVELDNHSDEFVKIAENETHEILYARFKSTEFIQNLFCEAIDVMIKFLDANVVDDEPIELVYRGIFTATAELEDGVKVMGVTPGESLKQIIKSDIVLS